MAADTDNEMGAEAGAARLAYIEERMAVVSTLSARQRQFVIGYLLHGNASRAAQAAGYAHPDKQGSRLLQNDKIKNAVSEYFYAQEMSAAEVVARLSEQAKAAYAPYLTAEGSVDLARLLADGLAHLIKGFKHTQYGLNVEFYDAHQALVDVGRYHGLFTDRIDASVGGQLAKVTIYIPDNGRGG